MPPRRRRAPVRQAPVAASKVHRISSLQQWHNMLQKAGNRVVVVQFFQAGVMISANLRQGFTHLSKQSRFKKVLFAEVELTEAPEVAEEAGVTRAPTYQCYYKAEMVSSYVGAMFPKVQEMLEGALKEYGGGGGGLLTKLLTALAVVGVVAAGAYAAVRLGRGEEEGEGGGSGDTLQDIERKLFTARQRLRVAERRNNAKAAVGQRKLITRLEARKRVLERSQGKQSSEKAGAQEAASSWFADFEDDNKQAAKEREARRAVVYTSEEE